MDRHVSGFQAQWLAVGIALGTGVGVAMKNIPVGVGVGAAFGVLIAVLRGRRQAGQGEKEHP